MMRFIKSRSPINQNSSLNVGFNAPDLVTSFNIINIKLGNSLIAEFDFCEFDLE